MENVQFTKQAAMRVEIWQLFQMNIMTNRKILEIQKPCSVDMLEILK